jgi:N-acetylglutamate synthase-like GNAT family acetyltransferase
MPKIHKGARANKTLANPAIMEKAVRMANNLFMVASESVPKYLTKKTNRRYAIANKKKFTGFAAVKNFPNSLRLELIAVTRNPKKRPPPGQKGWGTQLMKAIEKNAKNSGRKRVVVHDPIFQARGFYKKLGYNNISVTTGGTNRMAKNLSPNVTSKRVSKG